MSKSIFNQVQPCRDVAATVKFYVEKLGFELAFQDNLDKPG